jgi:hypothetical protein
MSLTGRSNFVTARSFLAAFAALVTVGAELLLRIKAQRSAINKTELFMIISFKFVLFWLGPIAISSQQCAKHMPEEASSISPVSPKSTTRGQGFAAKSFPTGARKTPVF